MAGIIEQARELRKVWSGFQSSRVLMTANNYRVFDYLEKQRTAGDLARRIGANKRATEILLDALTGLSLLRKQKGLYRNTSLVSRFLVSGRPHYQGDIIKHADTLWHNWSNLDKVVKTGNPHHSSRDHESFILGMHNLSVLKSREVIGSLDLKGVKKALDLGGGPGTYAMEIAKKGIEVTLFDTPETVKIAKNNVKVHGAGVKNINFVEGDFFINDIGKGYDLIFISQILHSNSEKDNLRLLKKC